MASDAEMKRIRADNRNHAEYFAAYGELPPQERWWYVASIYSGHASQKTLWQLESRRRKTEFDAHDLKDTLQKENPKKTYFVLSLTFDEAKILHGDN